MAPNSVHEVEHTIDIAAPADEIYGLIADVENWPRLFPPTIFVELQDQSNSEQTLRIWASANGEAKTWKSRRTLHPSARRIAFRQLVSTPPVAAMGGEWIVEASSDTTSTVRLLHDYRAVDDDPAGLAWISEVVDRNSRSELAALKANSELVVHSADLVLEFEDSIQIDGAGKDAFDFVNEAHLWAERLPHVSSVRLDEPSAGLQTLEMDTTAQDGTTHTTKSFRVCVPFEQIVYKQTTLPALMSVHTGRWTFVENDGGVRATSHHTVVLREENFARILGADAGVEQARKYVRDALGANSRATLGHAKDYAERVR